MYLCYCLKKNDGMINVKDNNNNENNNENNNINNKNSLCKIESLSSKTSTHQIENLFNNNKSEFNIHLNNFIRKIIVKIIKIIIIQNYLL